MPKDWNTVGESGSQSDQQNNALQNNQVTADKNEVKIEVKSEVKSEVQKEWSKVELQKSEQAQKSSNRPEQSYRQRPKFISDEQLLVKLKNQQIQERRKIKIVNLRSQQLLQEMKNHRLISYFKQIKIGDKPPFYIASFRTQEDLIQFIQEKIQNKYRFFLHQYVKSAKQIERQKQREYAKKKRFQDEPRQRDPYGNRRDNMQGGGGRRGVNRSQYQQSAKNQRKKQPTTRQTQPQTKPRYQNKVTVKQQKSLQSTSSTPYVKVQREKVKEQYKQKQKQKEKEKEKENQKEKVKEKEKEKQKEKEKVSASVSSPQFNFLIEKNIVTIKQKKYSKNRIVDDIVQKKITDKWDVIKIYVKKEGLDKALELAELIYERINYGLKSLPDQNTKEKYIQITLEIKCHVIHPNSQYKLLSGNENKYFQKINSTNKYRISKQFSVDEYMKGFKSNQKEVFKNWKQLLIRAQQQNIPKLLKLSWRLKRQLQLNVNIKVGAREEIPFSILEIQTDREQRPKVDASFLNSYLTN